MRRVLPLLIVAVSACATTSSERTATPNVQTVRVVDGTGQVTQLVTTATGKGSVATIPSSRAEAWRVLPGVYETLALPITLRNASTHVLGSQGFTARRRLGGVPLTRYFDCGRAQDGPSAESYELTITTQTRIDEGESGTTTVTTTIEASARPINFAGGAVRCSSTGALEARIAELLRERS